jgi:hypothetical protein
MADKTLNECRELSKGELRNEDLPIGFCGNDDLTLTDSCNTDKITYPSQGSLRKPPYDAVNENCPRVPIGSQDNCDPIQYGHIVEDQTKPINRETIARYSQIFRATDMAMKDLFSDLVVLDGNGKPHRIPIVLMGPERAVAYILQDNVRKDGSFVTDRIKLPILSLKTKSTIAPDQSRFLYSGAIRYYRDENHTPGWFGSEAYEKDTVFGKTRGVPVNVGYELSAWTMYEEDMDQVLEQMTLKFNPVAYLKLQGSEFEVIVRLEGYSNTGNQEPGDKDVRVIRWQFNMLVEIFVPQPIIRRKTVKSEIIDILEVDNSGVAVDMFKKMKIKKPGDGNA